MAERATTLSGVDLTEFFGEEDKRTFSSMSTMSESRGTRRRSVMRQPDKQPAW